MERKLVKQGRNALTVTLPAEWLHQKGLAQGDCVNIVQRNEQLIITSDKTSAPLETEVDLRGVGKKPSYHIIIGKYIEGYDTITVQHDSPDWAQEMGTILIGMVIEKQSQSMTVLKSIVAVPKDNFNAILRRTAHMLCQQAHMLRNVANGNAKWSQLKQGEHLLDDNLLYCLRYLNKYMNIRNEYKYFLMCLSFESIGDLLSKIGEHIKDHVAIAEVIDDCINNYANNLFTGDMPELMKAINTLKAYDNSNTCLNGLVIALAQNLSNFIGYLADQS
jgi:antitoxin component of MazEF toxin-antitoxin module